LPNSEHNINVLLSLTVLKRHVTCEELFSPGAPYIKRVITVGLAYHAQLAMKRTLNYRFY